MRLKNLDEDQFAVRVSNLSKRYRLSLSSKNKFLPWFRANKNTNEKYTQNHYFHALNNVSFNIKKGESWGFVGVNGSGKSTLLKIISGNLKPSSGHVEVNGKVAILDYGNGFNGEFTGKENIFLKASVLGLTKKQTLERYHSIVDFAEIGDFINQPVKTYSSGMSARLGFAIMAHVDADIIITDEALAVGDVFFVQKCMQFIRSFLKNGTFLFVSHSTNDVLSLCQHAIWLEHGAIKAIGPASTVTQAYLAKSHIDGVKNLDQDNDNLQSSLIIKENIKSEVVIEKKALSKFMNFNMSEDLPEKEKPSMSSDLYNEIDILYGECRSTPYAEGAKILHVMFCDEADRILTKIHGGQIARLAIHILAERELISPLAGFQLINHQGQVVIADNSNSISQENPFLVKEKTIFSVEFTFQMPFLPVGNHSMIVSVAAGKNEANAIILQTINPALLLRSVTSHTKHGLIGIPAQSITIEV